MATSASTLVDRSLQGSTCQEKGRLDSIEDVFSECSTFIESSDSTSSEDSFCDSSSDQFDVETLVIADWDDTLFPTTWLYKEGLLDDDVVLQEDQKEQLQKLADGALKTLRIAMQYSKVVIVTNAIDGWVEWSCKKMMPSLMQILEEVDIVSARSTYESCTSSPSEWKRLAFEHEFELLESIGAQKFNVISLGDSAHEQLAVMSLSERHDDCFGKSMKFLSTPTLEQLIAQHDVAASSILDIAEHNGNIDIEIEL